MAAKRTPEECFVKIREHLQETPGYEAWARLCMLLQEWPGLEDDEGSEAMSFLEEVVVPYVATHIDAWEDEHRHLPEHWLHQSSRALKADRAPPPYVALARQFYCGERTHLDDALRLFEHPFGERFTKISLCIDGLLPADLQKVLQKVHPGQLQGLSVTWCHMGDPAAELLAHNEGLASLKSLDLCGMDLSHEGLKALCESPYLQQLEALHLGFNREIGQRGIELLRNSKAFPHLRKLDLENADLDLGGLRPLVEAPAFAGLEHFNFGSCCQRPGAGVILRKAPYTPPLTYLKLNFNRLDDDDLIALSSWPSMEHIEHLELLSNNFTARSFKAMSQSPYFRKLGDLELCFSSDLTLAAFEHLSKAPWLKGLTILDLWDCNVGPKEIQALVSSPHLAALKDLNLRGSSIGTRGMKALLKAPLDDLEVLELCEGAIGLEAIKVLASSPRAQKLKDLDLENNDLSGECLWILLSSPHLGQLQKLDLSKNAIDFGIFMEAEQLPGCEKLEELTLIDCQMTGATLQAFLEHFLPLCPKLTNLNLWENPTHDDDALAIARCPHIAQLTSLNLDECAITEIGARHLLASPYLSRESHLNLNDNPIYDPELLEQLGQQLGVYIARYRSSELDDVDEVDELEDWEALD